MKTYEEFQAEVRRRKRDRWVRMLAREPPGRVPGRRPRAADKERLLGRLDKLRLDRFRADLGL
ncbi:MAG: hypothetical protein O7A04_04485 [Acidobacteria bacterium]|nr:hypothetical protein [Acidobacteriota bacterium]